MFRNLWVLLLPFALLTSACSLEANIDSLLKDALSSPPKLPAGVNLPTRPISGVVTDAAASDFLLSESFVGSHGVADGETPLMVVVRLMNSDNTVVAGHVPELEVVTGTGVIKAPCTASDNFGIAMCPIKSTDSGVKTIKFTNFNGFVVEKELVFDSPVKETTVIGSSGGEMQELSNPRGWKMSGTVGTSYGKVIAEDRGWKLYVGPISSNLE